MIIILIILFILIIILHYFSKNSPLIENLEGSNTDATTDATTNATTNATTDATTNATTGATTGDEQYQHYSDIENNQKTGPLFLALKNAANISSLHSKISALSNMNEQVTNLDAQVKTNSKAILRIGQEISKYAYSAVGATPPKVTG